MNSSSLRIFVVSCAAAGIVVMSGDFAAGQRPTVLTAGMVIDHSTTIRPGTYRITASEDLETPAITIRGENITVDFSGAVLDGGPDGADPDSYAGVGILIDGGSKITVKNAVVRGYKVGILARNSPDLRLTGNDVSYNWKQRLYSGIEKESLVDWMSYHNNEKDEWLRYGAGIYLRSCDRAEIDHNSAFQGQNGLMVTHSSGAKIWNNTFQFLSSIGVGLYRVSRSTIMHNRIDWCVRGYSHGFYNRGQDSAGLLMYEQSSNNTVAFNSVTHGGDGLFLWAGQSTMDTGRGGANDNLFYGNDFSHAPTNGIEATFSRNMFVNNRVEENWHGVWGGYSYESRWIGNSFARNAEGMAIEHGQDNVIQGNTFDRDGTAIRLWQNATQDPNWGYPKNRDTRSRGFRLSGNVFRGNKVALDIRNTSNVLLEPNTFENVGAMTSAETTGVEPVPTVTVIDPVGVSALPGGMDPMIEDGGRRGRHTIVVDEWGPYDWRAPKLWPVLDGDGQGLPFRRRPKAQGLFDGPVKLTVLGPQGKWKVVSARGASVAPTAGDTGDVIAVIPRSAKVVDYAVTLSYVGASITSPRGAITPSGRPYTFGYAHFFAPVKWTLNFYEYAGASDPVKEPDAFSKVLAGKPLKTVTADRIDYLSGGVLEDGVPRDRFAMSGEGTVDLPPGDYTLQVISDDGARVWVDGKLVLDAWEPHESRVDRVSLRGGRHTLRVHYFEAGGWAELRLAIQPRRTTQ